MRQYAVRRKKANSTVLGCRISSLGFRLVLSLTEFAISGSARKMSLLLSNAKV